MAATAYRYELRDNDQIVSTGHLEHDTPLEVGQAITIGRRDGIVRIIEPILGERELHLVVQLSPERRT
jgi:hypothetical protein